jgi:hypothetical protein
MTEFVPSGYAYLWQCSPSTERRGFRESFVGGKRPPCYLWQVKESTVKITASMPTKERPQGNCIKCKRRPKLHPHSIKTYHDAEDAWREAKRRNNDLVGYVESNTTEVIE